MTFGYPTQVLWFFLPSGERGTGGLEILASFWPPLDVEVLLNQAERALFTRTAPPRNKERMKPTRPGDARSRWSTRCSWAETHGVDPKTKSGAALRLSSSRSP